MFKDTHQLNYNYRSVSSNLSKQVEYINPFRISKVKF